MLVSKCSAECCALCVQVLLHMSHLRQGVGALTGD